jgi:hypothetical protein
MFSLQRGLYQAQCVVMYSLLAVEEVEAINTSSELPLSFV